MKFEFIDLLTVRELEGLLAFAKKNEDLTGDTSVIFAVSREGDEPFYHVANKDDFVESIKDQSDPYSVMVEVTDKEAAV